MTEENTVSDPTSREVGAEGRWILKWLTGHADDALKVIVSSIIGGLLVWYFSTSPSLIYGITQPYQYDGGVKFGLVTTYVRNDGSKEAEDLEWSVTLANADIREVKLSPEHLKPETTLSGHKWSARLPHLNKGEVIQATVLTAENGEIKSEEEVEVAVRAKGVNGLKAQGPSVVGSGPFMLGLGCGAMAAAVISIGLDRRKGRQLQEQLKILESVLGDFKSLTDPMPEKAHALKSKEQVRTN